MEQSLATVSLAVVICSLPQEFLWSRALLSAGALVCAGGAFWVELMSPTTKALAKSWLAAPKQALIFSALFLAALASQARASEHISHLALTTLFWQVSVPKQDRKGLLALVAGLQCVQTALVCGAYVALNPAGYGKYTFLFSAATVGLFLPAKWLLPGLLCSLHTRGDLRKGGRAGPGPPRHRAPSGPFYRSLASDDASENGLFDAADLGHDSNRWQVPAQSAPPPHQQPSLGAAAATAAATTAVSAATAKPGVFPGRSVRLRQPGTGPHGRAARARSLELRYSPTPLVGTQSSPWDLPGRGAISGPPSHGARTPTAPCRPEGVAAAARITAAAASATAAVTATIACQTDDELLLWLFTGGSTAPSANEDVRDEPRASYSGILSPSHQNSNSAELWGSLVKDESNASGGGGGGSGGASDRGGGDGYGGAARAGGVGKFDSFTSVWSRCAGGGYSMAPSARVSLADTDVLEGLTHAQARFVEEGRLSNGSQHGTAGSKLGPGQAQQATGCSQALWHVHAHPAASKLWVPGVVAGGAAAPVAVQFHSRRTGDGVSRRTGDGVSRRTGDGVSRKTGDGVSRRTGDGVRNGSSGFGFGGIAIESIAESLPIMHLTQHQQQHQQPPAAAFPQPHSNLSPPAPCTTPHWPHSNGPVHGSSGAAISAAAAAFQLGAPLAASAPPPPRDRASAAAAAAAAVAGVAPGSGPVSGRGVSTAIHAVAHHRRLQRSRTFNGLSVEGSRVLIGLATADGGSLPSTELSVSVPSPYSEDSEDETVQQLRPLRRNHPAAAGSLLRAGESGGGADGAITCGPSGGASRASAAAVTGLCHWRSRRKGRLVRRTQSLSSCSSWGGPAAQPIQDQDESAATGGGVDAEVGLRPQDSSRLRSVLELPLNQHQHLQPPNQSQANYVTADGGTLATSLRPRRLAAAVLKESSQTGVVASSNLGNVGGNERAVGVKESPQPPEEELSEAEAAPTASNGDSVHAANTGSAVPDAYSELSFEQHLPPSAQGAAYGDSTTSSRRWSCASSSVSVATVGSRGEWLSMSAMEGNAGQTAHGSVSAMEGNAGQTAHGSVSAMEGDAGQTAHGSVSADDRGLITGGAAAHLRAEYGRRAHQVQRSRSAGETGFRSGNAAGRGAGRLHWSQLPHQEHRRAALMQAWQAMLSDAALHRYAATPASAAIAVAAVVASQPSAARRPSDSDGALPYGADPRSPPAADAGSATSGSPPGRSPTSPSSAVAGVVITGRRSSGDGSGSAVLRRTGGAGAAAVTAGSVDSAPAAGDDRSVRLCKSLSERSLQQRLVAGHQRRVARTKSRFALLQQEFSEGSVGAGSSGTLPRISSGGSMISRQLENVLEEQEQEEGEEGELLAAAAAVAAAGSVRGSVSSRRSVNDGDFGFAATATTAVSAASSPKLPLRLQARSRSDCGHGSNGVNHRTSGTGAITTFEAAIDVAIAEAAAATAGDGIPGSVSLAEAAFGSIGYCEAASAFVGDGSFRRRAAGRSASELSFTSFRIRRSRASVGFSVTSSGGGGGGTSSQHCRCGSSGSGVDRDRAMRCSESAADSARVLENWLRDGDESVRSRFEHSVISLDGGASLAPSLIGSRGSRGGGGGSKDCASARPSVSGIAARESQKVIRARCSSGAARGDGGSAGRGTSTTGGRRGGRCSSGSRSGSRAAADDDGDGDGMDSDEELLDVLVDEAVMVMSRGLQTASGCISGIGGGSLRRLRHHQAHGGVPSKTASFRFAAPIVLALPPQPPKQTAAIAAAALQRGGGAAAAAAGEVEDVASPFSVTALLAQGHSHVDGLVGQAAAPAGSHKATPAAAAAAVTCSSSSSSDDIPAPPLAAPVLPELERERERTRERPLGQLHGAAAGDVGAPGPGSYPGPSAQQTLAAASAAAHPAPLSTQNLQHHTRHWEAAAPRGSDPAALALQLPSPSPSQSGPMDPLSDGEPTPSPVLMAVLNTTAAATDAATAACSGGGSNGSLQSPSPAENGTRAAAGGGGGGNGGNGGNGSSIPRAAIVARLSMPLMRYNNADATTTLIATVAAAAGRHSITSALSRQASNNTLSGLSARESVGSLTDGGAGGSAGAQFMQSGDDLLNSATSTAVSAAAGAAAAQILERQRSSAISRSPSVLVGASNAGRSAVLRLNSGGGTAGAAAVGPLSGARAGFMPSTVRQPSKLSTAGAALSGSEAMEREVEEAVLTNRRILDDRGTLLEEINIDKVLGFGSMGMVYHGRLYDTKVVVKFIEHGTGVLGKEKERGRLARVEASVSRMLLHPNIVLTYDACTGSLQPGRLAAKLGRGGGGVMGGGGRGGRQRFMTVMVQEFCELGTLKDAVSKRRHGLAAWLGGSTSPPSPGALPLLYRVALDIANGMKHLAALRIIHADLKAENVLLQKVEASSDRPHGFCAKVADFGLAMVLPPGEDEVRQGIHGTVSHMPPEAMKDTVFSLATDVFSFGVVLWELFTTESPYRGMAPHEVVEAVCVRAERPPWPPDSPAELVALAEDCWQADPLQRPSFDDVVDKLRQLLAPTHGPPERCASMLSDLTEDSDELEMALRQQQRGGAGAGAAAAGGHTHGHGHMHGHGHGRASSAWAGGRAVSDADSERAAPGGRGGGQGGGDAVGDIPRAAPRDPLGLLLWALCQFPREPPLRVAGPAPDSEQWVLQVEDMVIKSRQDHAEEGAAAAAARASCSGTGSAVANARSSAAGRDVVTGPEATAASGPASSSSQTRTAPAAAAVTDAIAAAGQMPASTEP